MSVTKFGCGGLALSRIPLVSAGNLSAEQQVVYDKIVAGPRGTLVGPLRAALHSPELADRWQALGELLRYNSSVSARLSELAIIVVGRFWNSDVEWFIHAEAAANAGLSPDIIEDIRSAHAPEFATETDAAIYEYARQLTEGGAVDDNTYGAVHRALGTVGVVELTAIIGYYTMVCMTLNAHAVPVPEGERSALRTLPPPSRVGSPTLLPPARAVARRQVAATVTSS